MYHKTLAECFPYSELPTLYECTDPECFYSATLLNHRDVTWKNLWNGVELVLAPYCPSCDTMLTLYEDPDGTI